MELCAQDLMRNAAGAAQPCATVGRGSSRTGASQVIWNANQTNADYPRNRCLHHLLTETAQREASRTAVAYRDESLTYAQLDARSNRLAHFLQEYGIGPQSLVGLCVERSLEMVVALVGILKAGAAYVPLDPGYPADRIQYVLDDAGVRLLLTQERLRSSMPHTSADIVSLDSESSLRADIRSDEVFSQATPSDLAYIIYTSGSTGRPKGVQIEHRSLVNFLWS